MAGSRVLDNFIDGRWVPAADGRALEVLDPVTDEVQAEQALSGPADVEAAMSAADKAFRDWRRTTQIGRAHV